MCQKDSTRCARSPKFSARPLSESRNKISPPQLENQFDLEILQYRSQAKLSRNESPQKLVVWSNKEPQPKKRPESFFRGFANHKKSVKSSFSSNILSKTFFLPRSQKFRFVLREIDKHKIPKRGNFFELWINKKVYLHSFNQTWFPDRSRHWHPGKNVAEAFKSNSSGPKFCFPDHFSIEFYNEVSFTQSNLQYTKLPLMGSA